MVVRGYGMAMGREKKKSILRFLLRLFWGKCSVGITCHPIEVRISWNDQVYAMRDREREREHTHYNK